VLGEGTMVVLVVLGDEGDAWREVEGGDGTRSAAAEEARRVYCSAAAILIRGPHVGESASAATSLENCDLERKVARRKAK